MQVDPIGEPGGERRPLFPRRIRRILFYSGLFVLYAQLVSAGLTGVYRYAPWEPTWLGGGNRILGPCTLTLLQPPAGEGTIENWRDVGWNIEFSTIRYIAWAVIAPILGSAPLFFASIAGTGWRSHSLLVLASCLGIVAACAVKLHEWVRGAPGWFMLAQVITDGSLPHAPYPIYGHAELIGSFFMPIVMYVSIVLFIVVARARAAIRCLAASRKRRLNQRT